MNSSLIAIVIAIVSPFSPKMTVATDAYKLFANANIT